MDLQHTTITQPATISLQELLGRYELGLVLIAGGTEETMHTPVQWVHGSDLKSPAPFLTPRTVLLTTGTQFPKKLAATDSHKYVRELLDAGVSALGFGIDIAHSKIPHQLVTACEELKLPLFRVPYDTPFIAISQTAARALAAQSYERELWSLKTQRAIARSAISKNTLAGAVEALSLRLDRWVAVASNTGIFTFVSGTTPEYLNAEGWIAKAVREITAKPGMSNTSRRSGPTSIHLQTIHGPKKSRGVLIVENTTPLDHAELTAIELVGALAAVSLTEETDGSINTLKNTLGALLVTGNTDLAENLAKEIIYDLPKNDAVLLNFGTTTELPETLLEQLLLATQSKEDFLLFSYEESFLALMPADSINTVDTLLAGLRIKAGSSKPKKITQLKEALTESSLAKKAFNDKKENPGILKYSAGTGEGMLTLLKENMHAKELAKITLAPLLEHDKHQSEDLLTTLKTWFEAGNQTSATAARLSVHRHTVTNRLRVISELLDTNLNNPAIRFEIQLAILSAS